MAWRPGPGLLVAAAFLGPGTLATATVAGAETAYGLLWVVPASIALAFVVQELAARLPLATGRPLARVIAEQGPGGARWARWLAYAAVGAVVLGAAAFQAGNLAGAALGLTVLTEGPAVLWSIAVADVAFLLLWFGRYDRLETVLTALVVLMAAAFALQIALVGIDRQAALAGLVPSLDGTSIALVLALVGTTVVPYNLFLHTSALEADGTRRGDGIGPMRTDLAVSLLIGGLITASVLLSSALTLRGREVQSAAQMAFALRPLMGPLAEVTIGLGMAAAGLTSAVTAPLAAAWAVDQLRDNDARDPSRAVWIPVLLVGAAVAVLPFEPIGLIVTAQLANALILPLVLAACLAVANWDALGRWSNGWLANLAGLAALATALLLVLRLAL